MIMISFAALVIISSLFTSKVVLDSINPPGCGVAKALGKIVNGETTERIRMPWMVHTVTKYKIQQTYVQLACGGTILSRNFILTAAHCVSFGYQRPYSIDVRYNSTYLEEGPIASAKDVIRHPRFSMTTIANDIALVKLAQPLLFDKFVKPICLPMRRLQLVNKKAFASGWGKVTEGGKSTDRLRYLETKFLPFRKCNPSFNPLVQQDVFTGTQVLCTETNGKGVCQGDSGGPVFIWRKGLRKFFQVGIISFSVGCSEDGHPNVHTRVSYFVPWIRNMMWIRWWI